MTKRKFPSLVLAAALSGLLLAPSASEAQRAPQSGARATALLPLNVRAVVSTNHRRQVLRATVIEREGVPLLSVEVIGRHRRRGSNSLRLISQAYIEQAQVPGRRRLLDLYTRATGYELQGWEGPTLRFAVLTTRTRFNCALTVQRGTVGMAECVRDGHNPGHQTGPYIPPQPTQGPYAPPQQPNPYNPPPTQYNWSASVAVIEACGRSFEGATNENACLDAVTQVGFDPTQLIAQCDSSMEGDANELACVRVGAAAPADPSGAIAACDAAMEGDANELACIQAAAPVLLDLAPGIAACEAAMEGDASELACIQAIARARQDMSATIAACDQAMSGDASELGCIERAVR